MSYFSISKNVLNQIREDKIYRVYLNKLIDIKISFYNLVKGFLETNMQLQK